MSTQSIRDTLFAKMIIILDNYNVYDNYLNIDESTALIQELTGLVRDLIGPMEKYNPDTMRFTYPDVGKEDTWFRAKNALRRELLDKLGGK